MKRANAARMAADPAWRNEVSRTLLARRDVLHRDLAVIEALARWILEAVATSDSAPRS